MLAAIIEVVLELPDSKHMDIEKVVSYMIANELVAVDSSI